MPRALSSRFRPGWVAAGGLAAILAGGLPLLTPPVAHASAAPVAAPRAVTTTTTLAVEGTDSGHAMYVSQAGAAFTSYSGGLQGEPALLSYQGRTFYFVRGTTSDIYVRTDTTGWTFLRRGLKCVTAPGVASDGQGVLRRGLRGDHRLPLRGRGHPCRPQPPRTRSAARPPGWGAAVSTPTPPPSRGGVGKGAAPMELLAIGPSYRASGSVGAGNVYAYISTASGVSVYPQGVSCSYAPTLIDTTSSGFMVCHSPTSAETLAYRNDDGVVTVTDLGGAALRSPVAVANDDADSVEVFVTGTTSRIYTATVEDSGTGVGFTAYPAAGTAAAGPGATTPDTDAHVGAGREAADGFAR